MKSELGIAGLVIMYVGNLEEYQGIDLLLGSFAEALKRTQAADLVIIGGQPLDIERYKRAVGRLGIQTRVHFLGQKPLEELGRYLSAADILVSPRVKGSNTPMKLYSYLHSGKPVLATNLPTHTQLINENVALLVEPRIEEFSNGLVCLIKSPNLRGELGTAGRRFIEEGFTYEIFKEKLTSVFSWLESELPQTRPRLRVRPLV